MLWTENFQTEKTLVLDDPEQRCAECCYTFKTICKHNSSSSEGKSGCPGHQKDNLQGVLHICLNKGFFKMMLFHPQWLEITQVQFQTPCLRTQAEQSQPQEAVWYLAQQPSCQQRQWKKGTPETSSPAQTLPMCWSEKTFPSLPATFKALLTQPPHSSRDSKETCLKHEAVPSVSCRGVPA